MHSTNRRNFLKSGVGGIAGLASVPLLGSLAGCQTAGVRPQGAGGAASLAPPTITSLTDRVRLVAGAPGNLLALSGGDGLVLVDSGSAAHAPGVQKALGGTVRTLINTHYHADQTGGNALFAGAGAEIRAHTITKQWLAADYWVPGEMRWEKAPPKAAVPVVTFRDKGEMLAGSERIEYGYLLEAHTRGDCYVFLRDSNVLAVGDVASPQRDPVHDWFAGGWLGGRIDAMEDLLQLADDQTRIVPSYGPVMTKAELAAEREWMVKVYDTTAKLTATGRSARDMYDQKVLDELGRPFQDPFRFLYDLAKGYQAHYTNVGNNVV